MNRLEEIMIHKRKEVAEKKAAGLQERLEARIHGMSAPRDFAAAMIEFPEPESRLVSRITFAPPERHWSACERIFSASPSALTTVAVTPDQLVSAGGAKPQGRVTGRAAPTGDAQGPGREEAGAGPD